MTNRQSLTRSVLGCGIALVVACGSDKHGPFVTPGGDAGASATGNRAGAGGSSGRGNAAGRAGAGDGSAGIGGGTTTSPLAPVIEITAPTAASDPNVGPVLVEDQVTVLCTVKDSPESGAKAVDPSSVKIELFDADGKSIKSSAGASTANKSEYSATFVLAALSSGSVSFGCSASDTATPKHSAVASLETLLDRGPEITIGEPVDKSAHKLQGSMNVEFTAVGSPIASGDKQAGVSSVTLLVGGVKIPTVDKTNGLFQATVNFADKSQFDSAPSGTVPIVISASNSRKKPGKATRTLPYSVVVDGVGPSIVFGLPAAETVIGRASILTFNVADVGSGVDPATVAVTVNSETRIFSSTDGQWTWNEATGAFSFKMGAALAKNNLDTQVTVALLAKDKAGNASPGTSRLYNLDNKPPIVDLDPPMVYEVRGSDPETTQCSDLFDPLGAFDKTAPAAAVNGSPDDTSTIINYGRFRSLVWDETNSKLGQGESYLAMTDRESVRLYVQPNTDSPLLADDDGDGVCDEIWTGTAPHQFKPTDKPLPFLKMVAIAPTGAPVWGGPEAPAFPACKPGPTGAFTPLCGTPGVSDMSVVIRHPVVTLPFEPVIYAVEPNNNIACTGQKWDVSTAITMAGGEKKLGWVCIAARAVDNVGNAGISPPLRICLGDETNLDPCKDIAPPSCTNSCTPPPHFNPVGPVKHN
ncbi:MAG TPA: hypothetical protein VJV79_32875 [Polyangiaceae bacterium]|nr:hypothetical protein [Polyangiaceae bacterium]